MCPVFVSVKSENLFLHLPLTSSSSFCLFFLFLRSHGAVLPDEGRGVQVQPGVRLHRAHLHHHDSKSASLRQVRQDVTDTRCSIQLTLRTRLKDITLLLPMPFIVFPAGW